MAIGVFNSCPIERIKSFSKFINFSFSFNSIFICKFKLFNSSILFFSFSDIPFKLFPRVSNSLLYLKSIFDEKSNFDILDDIFSKVTIGSEKYFEKIYAKTKSIGTIKADKSK